MSRRGRHAVPIATKLVIAAVLAIAAAGGLVVTARATDSASFCPTCHEMRPYNAAWAAGPHRNVECVECHVAPGTLNRLAHKFVALGEVRSHFFGHPTFPLKGVGVPNSRCLACHPSVKVRTPVVSRFSHDLHEAKAECWECHTTAGHSVTLEALKAAGVLAPSARPQSSAIAGTRKGQPIEGHVRTSCLRCHDQSKMSCATCHKAPHKDRGPCRRCHRPGTAFAFVHPSSGACADCHRPPSRHPATAGASCDTCHRSTGRSWAFTHPVRKDCAACHKAPANHFGANCAACHQVGKPFAQTVFNHPPTAHGWRSQPCVACHPKGPPAVSCTCHGGGTTGGGD